MFVGKDWNKNKVEMKRTKKEKSPFCLHMQIGKMTKAESLALVLLSLRSDRVIEFPAFSLV
jgi:hypothetical protein